jgi:hypothetical protein
LSEVGWVAGVMVNRTTGNVVDGHLRIELALARQEATVPVTYVELTEAEEALVLATLDPIGAIAEAEATGLASLLSGLEPTDDALRALLDDLTREQGVDLARASLVDPDDAPELPDEPSVHRATCLPSATIASCAVMRPIPPTSGAYSATPPKRT